MAGRASAGASARARAQGAATSRGPALRSVRWKEPPPDVEAFPWSVPAVRTLDMLDLGAPVTFFVGENGSGKSTLLEAIAIAAQLRTVGSERDAYRDPTLGPQRALAARLQLSFAWRPPFGFFLRAEDFFGYLKARARDAARVAREAGRQIRIPDAVTDHDVEYDPQLHAHVHPDEFALGAFVGAHDARSHGESFLDLFTAQLDAPGLYLLDEPETPLSPQRQLAFLALMFDAVRTGAQCIVATHSPILLAYPGARIYHFGDGPVREVAYEELEHVRITRDFLNAPERFLRHLA